MNKQVEVFLDRGSFGPGYPVGAIYKSKYENFLKTYAAYQQYNFNWKAEDVHGSSRGFQESILVGIQVALM